MINVNGRYLKRARDNFGRAVAATGITGSGGILEAGNLDVNTWLPVSSTTFVMNLDGLVFKNKFPDISLQSPSGVIDLTNSFVHDPMISLESVAPSKDSPGNAVYIGNFSFGGSKEFANHTFTVDGFSKNVNNGTFKYVSSSSTTLTLANPQSDGETRVATATLNLQTPSPEVVIAGVRWDCTTDCGSILPPLAHQKVPAEGIIGIARWAASGEPDVLGGGPMDQLCITLQASTTNQPAATPSATTSPLQVLTDTDSSVWGPRPNVLLDNTVGHNEVIPITNCRPFGARWVCSVLQSWRQYDVVVRIEDFDHPGGPFVGEGTVQKCDPPGGVQCSNPFIWRNAAPVWNDPDGAHNAWTLKLSMANLQAGDKLALNNDHQMLSLPADPLDCKDYSKLCDVRFTIPRDKFDEIKGTTRLQVFDANGNSRGTPTALGLLPSISPVVTQIVPAQKTLKGNPLVFDKMQIGENGKPMPILCNASTDATQCSLSKNDPDAKGYLFFVTPSSIVKVASADGTQVLHDPAAIKAAATTLKPSTVSGASVTNQPASAAPSPAEKKPSVSQSQTN